MATPLTPDQMLRALKAEGVNVREYRDWDTHNRNHKGPWGPVHGVMIHHTVTGPDVGYTVRLCYDGHSELPGPLCHAVGGKDGAVYLVGHGRSNHAGSGDGDVLAAVKLEAAVLPADNEADTDGNRYFYGIEIQNRGDGQDPYPVSQYNQAVRWAAALCRAHGWSARSVVGHKEWQPGKVDPSFDMAAFRMHVNARLTEPPVRPPAPAPTTTTVGGTMEFTSLAMTDAPETLLAGQSRIIYWDAEYQDGAGDHGTGGKTIVSGEHVTGVVALQFTSALPAGVRAYMVHELDAGGTSNDYATDLPAGHYDVSVPYTARVAEDRNLVFKIENTSGSTVVLNWAAARFGTWAL